MSAKLILTLAGSMKAMIQMVTLLLYGTDYCMKLLLALYLSPSQPSTHLPTQSPMHGAFLWVGIVFIQVYVGYSLRLGFYQPECLTEKLFTFCCCYTVLQFGKSISTFIALW